MSDFHPTDQPPLPPSGDTPLPNNHFPGNHNPNDSFTSAPNVPGKQPVIGDGRLPIGQCISTSFRALIDKFGFWLLMGLFPVAAAVVNAIVDQVDITFINFLVNIAMIIFSLIWGVYLTRAALLQHNGAQVNLNTVFTGFNLGRAVVTQIIAIIISFTIMAVFTLFYIAVFSYALFNSINSGEITALLFLSIIIGIIVFSLGSSLVSPLIMCMVPLSIDHEISVGDAVSQGLKIGVKNYGKLFVFNLVLSFIVLLAVIFTLGIFGIIAMPLVSLAQTYAYRRITGGFYLN